jgi:PTH1 family peptidyl-tRNA hydrolase
VTEVWLVVGLGNPGERYAGTRHNVGQLVIDRLAGRSAPGTSFRAHRGQALVAETRLAGSGGALGSRVVLAKPTSYMNLSGGPVAGLVRYFRVDLGSLVIVHDELDVDFGSVKIKRGGGDAGHNGLRSVTASLGSPDYLRVRVGIGRPPGRMDPADFVLTSFPASSRVEVDLLVEGAADAVEAVVVDGLPAAQQRFHGRA